MNVKEIISLLPKERIKELALESGVDRYAKKINGELMFNLLIYCILSYKDNSLRRMESHFEKASFSYLNSNGTKVKYNSISDRLSTMNVSYFRNLYEEVVEIYGPYFKDEPSKLVIYDSTIVSLSSNLLKVGYDLGKKQKFIKYSVGYSDMPTISHIYTEQSYSAENVALKETIFKDDKNKELIKVFDRGINSRSIYDKLVDDQISFVSRINTNCKYDTIESLKLKDFDTPTLKIESDEIVQLFSEKSKAKHTLRLIKTEQKSTGDKIYFITSIRDLSVVEISEIYKKRWDIEVFFKFLKQELNFSHFINRSTNGIEIVMYTTLIAAILLLVYKKTNRLKGYKIMKQNFLQELEWEIIADLVILAGGNPALLDKLRGKSPPI